MVILTKKDEDAKTKRGPKPNGVFWGILLGSVAGCVPLFSVLQAIFLFLIVIFRTNIFCAVLFFAAGKFFTMQYLPDSVDRLGLYILTENESMIEFSRWFTRLPAVTYLNFTNSMVMGGAALGIAAGLPTALIFRHIALLFERKARAKEKAQAEERAKLEKKNAAALSAGKIKKGK